MYAVREIEPQKSLIFNLSFAIPIKGKKDRQANVLLSKIDKDAIAAVIEF